MSYIGAFFIGLGVIFFLKAVGVLTASFGATLWGFFFIVLGIYVFKKERDFKTLVKRVEKAVSKAEHKVERAVSDTFGN